MIFSTDFSAIELQGKDSRDFLHRLSSASLLSLSPEMGTKGLLLEGNSRLIAPFFALCLEQEKIICLVPDGRGEAFLAALERLHFSENISLQAWPNKIYLSMGRSEDWPCQWASADHEMDRPAFAFHRDEKVIAFPLPVPQGSLAIVLDSKLEKKLADPPFYKKNSVWALARMRAEWPEYGAEWTEQSMALDAGFLHWIHRTKGCYPGQEVVEKSLNLGHPAKAIFQIKTEFLLEKGDAVAAAMDPITKTQKILGEITSCEKDSQGWLALASARWQLSEYPQIEILKDGRSKGAAKCQRW